MSAEKKKKTGNKKSAGEGGYLSSTAGLLEWGSPVEGADLVYSTTELIDYSRGTVRLPEDGRDSRKHRKHGITVRPLTQREISILDPVFGKQLDYGKIKVRIGGLGTFGDINRGIFNSICVTENSLKKNGDVEDEILIHEAAHVWQFQKTIGWTYAPEAVWQHIKSGITRGRYDPYKFDLLEGIVPWDRWNPEAQAQWIQKKKKLPPPEIINPVKK